MKPVALPRLLAHAPQDLALVAVAIAGAAMLPVALLAWREGETIALVCLFVVQAAIICTNYQCVSHNFVHNEFFASTWLNTAFSMLNSVALGFPQTVFKQHHLNHHRYNNAPYARDGVSPGDLSSLHRYSKTPGGTEGFLRYSLLSPLRADIPTYVRHALRRRDGLRLALDCAALLGVMAALAFASASFFLFFYLPLIFFGHVLTYAEGYFEHNKGVPGDPRRNAVSCYGRAYNILWFNNGYHQEHHCFPHIHWTEIPSVRNLMLPELDRRVVRGAHWVNF
jgi:fatty acid desaturase